MERSITGMWMEEKEEEDVDLSWERVWGGCMKIRGMEVMPESERPLTPILDSENSFTSFIRS